MSNSLASLRLVLSAPGPGGSTLSLSASVLAPFLGSNAADIDVPASSTATYTIPFGSVSVAATLVVIQNNTDADIAIKINGAAAVSHHIPAGGCQAIGGDAAPTAVPITAMSATAANTAAGTISCWVFGDPGA